MSITEDEIARLKAEHPGAELHLLSNADTGVEVVVKSPPDGEWARFRKMQSDEAQRPLALRALVLGCIIKPTAAEFQLILGQRPGLAETFGGELVELAGLSRATTRRKL